MKKVAIILLAVVLAVSTTSCNKIKQLITLKGTEWTSQTGAVIEFNGFSTCKISGWEGLVGAAVECDYEYLFPDVDIDLVLGGKKIEIKGKVDEDTMEKMTLEYDASLGEGVYVPIKVEFTKSK